MGADGGNEVKLRQIEALFLFEAEYVIINVNLNPLSLGQKGLGRSTL